MAVGAVGRGFARRSGEGEQYALGAADPPETGLHLLDPGDGDRAAPRGAFAGACRGAAFPGVGWGAERIVAAGVEDDQADLRHCRDRRADLFERQRRGLQGIERGCVGVDGQQPVVAGDLDAVAGKVDQRHVGAAGILAEILDGAACAAQVAIDLQRHFEAEAFEDVADRLRVIDRVVELADRPVVVLADDQRHAAFRRRRAGKQDEHKNKQNARHSCPRWHGDIFTPVRSGASWPGHRSPPGR